MDVIVTTWQYIETHWLALVVFIALVVAGSIAGEWRVRRARKSRNEAARKREDREWWEEKNRLRYNGLLNNEGQGR